MPVYITQNIAPKIGIANGSTGFVLGCQFPENTDIRTPHVNGAAMKIASAPPDIVYVSLDQAKLTSRFPGVPETYPENTVPILPYTLDISVLCLTDRSFCIKMTQIPISPSFVATTHKL